MFPGIVIELSGLAVQAPETVNKEPQPGNKGRPPEALAYKENTVENPDSRGKQNDEVCTEQDKQDIEESDFDCWFVSLLFISFGHLCSQLREVENLYEYPWH